MTLPLTPSQTIGPFFHIGLPGALDPYVVQEGTAGAFWVRGVVFDGAGAPVPDALVETWQADQGGRFAHPDDPRGAAASEGFLGFGRCPTGPDGSFGVLTVKPGCVPDRRAQPQAPHIAISLFARGLLHRVVTRLYFADEMSANLADSVFGALPAARRGTLIAKAEGDGYRFDIHLQGEHETIFFSI
jgi:protocatechuate 3,4-dioxygenase alpha subunit